MEESESSGISCIGCAGTCCTYEANSMMVTPLEAFDLLTYLKNSQKLTDDLKNVIKETVRIYRLDKEVSTGRGSSLRRTYTCPFFTKSELGCPLPREVKPYGCLAFNTHHETEKTAEHCYSDVKLLEDRETVFANEEEENHRLRKEYALYWEKLPMPVALLELWERV